MFSSMYPVAWYGGGIGTSTKARSSKSSGYFRRLVCLGCELQNCLLAAQRQGFWHAALRVASWLCWDAVRNYLPLVPLHPATVRECLWQYVQWAIWHVFLPLPTLTVELPSAGLAQLAVHVRAGKPPSRVKPPFRWSAAG